MAQSGANGWATTFHLDHHGVIIDLRGLNGISFNEERNKVTVGGGITIGELVDGAYSNGVQVGKSPRILFHLSEEYFIDEMS